MFCCTLILSTLSDYHSCLAWAGIKIHSYQFLFFLLCSVKFFFFLFLFFFNLWLKKISVLKLYTLLHLTSSSWVQRLLYKYSIFQNLMNLYLKSKTIRCQGELAVCSQPTRIEIVCKIFDTIFEHSIRLIAFTAFIKLMFTEAKLVFLRLDCELF